VLEWLAIWNCRALTPLSVWGRSSNKAGGVRRRCASCSGLALSGCHGVLLLSFSCTCSCAHVPVSSADPLTDFNIRWMCCWWAMDSLRAVGIQLVCTYGSDDVAEKERSGQGAGCCARSTQRAYSLWWWLGITPVASHEGGIPYLLLHRSRRKSAR
jgi:hypothetical protein